MNEVERLADHVLMLRQGKIVDQGSPEDLLFRYSRQNLEEVFLDIARDRRADDHIAARVADAGAETEAKP
jgi:ABC-2 type transport system ATP-binding protein